MDIAPFDRISELEEVEKVVYLTRTSKDGKHENRYRVEAVRDHNGKYRELSVIVQPSEIADGQRLAPEEATIWVRDNQAPWTDRDSAEGAIKHLLSLWQG
jgi:hypothetical protein